MSLTENRDLEIPSPHFIIPPARPSTSARSCRRSPALLPCVKLLEYSLQVAYFLIGTRLILTQLYLDHHALTSRASSVFGLLFGPLMALGFGLYFICILNLNYLKQAYKRYNPPLLPLYKVAYLALTLVLLQGSVYILTHLTPSKLAEDLEITLSSGDDLVTQYFS